MKALEQNTLKFIAAEKLIEPGDKILVALSGGPDSVFLLLLLDKFKNKLKIGIGAAHVNHMLRGKDADADEMFCRQLCDDMHIAYFSDKADVKRYAKENKHSIEEAARILRYRALNGIAQKENYNKIAVAHNINDNAETVLLNLIKGSGISGIAGIPVKRDNLIRPLLNAYKSEILSYLAECGQEFRIDKTNEDENFERNYIRKTLLPAIKNKLNPSVEGAIFNSSQTLSNAKTVLSGYIEEFEADCVRFASNMIEIDIAKIKDRELPVLGEIIKHSVRKRLNKEIGYNDYLTIKELMEKQKGRRADLSSRLFAVKEKNFIVIGEKKRNESSHETVIHIGEEKETEFGKIRISAVPRKEAKIGKDPKREYISGDKLESPEFLIRSWKKGDKFIPLGMKGYRKLSDFLTDRKIDSLNKKEQPVLVNKNDIVWAVGLRIDDRYKITETTNTVIELCLK
jgi:tRNA(Ile)-lysidine synthase